MKLWRIILHMFTDISDFEKLIIVNNFLPQINILQKSVG